MAGAPMSLLRLSAAQRRHSWALLLALLLLAAASELSCADTPNWDIAGSSYRLMRGNLHVHTYLSAQTEPWDINWRDGSEHRACQWPRETWKQARKVGLDCLGFSDHCRSLSKYDWSGLADISDEARREGFTALRGFEWTSDNAHVNVFGTSSFVSFRPRVFEGEESCPRVDTLKGLYDWVRNTPGALCQFNHPNRNGLGPPPAKRFEYNGESFGLPGDSRIVDAFALLAIGSGGKPAYAFNSPKDNEPWYRLALSKGWRVAPAIDIDNNTELDGTARERCTGVWVQDGGDARDAMLDALRHRRTFASEEKDYVMRVWALYDGRQYPMGSALPAAGRKRIGLYIDASNPGGVGVPTIVEVRRDGSVRSTDLGSAYENAASHQWVAIVEPTADTVCWYVHVVKQRKLIEGSGVPTEATASHVISAPIWLGSMIYEWTEGHGPGHPGVGAPGMPSEEVAAKGPVDLVFCIDCTSSMHDDIDRVKRDARDLVARLRKKCSSLRIGLVTYRDFAVDGSRHLETNLPLTEDIDKIVGAIQGLGVTGGGDPSEDVLDGLMAAIRMDWRDGVGKFIVLMGDASAKDPDHEGKTKETIAEAARAVDPAHVYALALNRGGIEDFRKIAALTDGEAFTVEDVTKLSEAIENAVSAAIVHHSAEVGGVVAFSPAPDWQLPLLISALVGVFVLGVLCVAIAARRRMSLTPLPSAPLAWLQVYEPNMPPRNVPVLAPIVRLGRDPRNAVVLSDPTVSKTHAELTVYADQAVITDLNSTHGTNVNGQRVSRQAVMPRDRIELGGTILMFFPHQSNWGS